ncbi:Uncharacterized protein M6B38_212265 [Iris pallida]|uniref:Coenzyme Q-binding protein COQ10 START domain-containing protein n=1 Tax=Iris pallida TaxID=29817 RepID=A0AAX6E3F4_IRIPA|nr:Uncharacterized protein M6B38_212265 [Iris pallida]
MRAFSKHCLDFKLSHFSPPPPPPFLPTPVLPNTKQKLHFSSRATYSYSSNGDGSKWRAQAGRWKRQRQQQRSKEEEKEEFSEEEEGETREVHCEVDVVSWRERKIKARVLVNADVDSLWDVLTDYERLADFIPNLVYSGRIACPHQGRIWLEQRGLQQGLYWHIEARVVLDLQEFPDLVNGRELRFSMVDGDFKKFEGKWSVKVGPRSSSAILSYEVNVVPRFNFPAIFIERIICSDLPVNLRALASRAETNFGKHQNLPLAGIDVGAALPGGVAETDVQSSDEVKENYAFPGLTAVPVSPNIEYNSNWGVFGKVCRLDRPCMVDEVHLRRFDGLLDNGGTHQCVIASITVKAPVQEVWSVLTAYETLPEIVPNLAISKILLRDNNKVRILQEGCKGLLYMVLHARVVLDLHEKYEEEISFEQVEGDFNSFQGKWLLEQLGNQHTLLKYIVESKMRKDTFLSEALVEEVIYEDLPSNLCAIRDFVEKREAATSDSFHIPDEPILSTDIPAQSTVIRTPEKVFSSSANPSKQRPKVPGLQKDIEILKAEILAFISMYGQEGFMPMRKQLRLHGRVDIEKAITRSGGFRKIANLMNLSLAYKHRKPMGYWDNFENLQEEISRFQRSWGMDPAYMPSRKSFERAGRYDIARALEKWGGVQEVSRLLSLELRHQRRRRSDPERSNQDSDASRDKNGQEMFTGPTISEETQKWLTKLKDLDINWVE